MGRHEATKTRLVMLMAATALLSACATTPQPVARDDADRMFLKLVEIAQRPTPAKSDDLDELGRLVDHIPTSGDDCMSKNFLVLNAGMTALKNDLDDDNPANWPRKSADLRQALQHLQAAPLSSDGCAFPRVKIG